MAIRTLRSGGTAHPENDVLQFNTDSIITGGVIDLGSANHFQVTAQTPPAMFVNVNNGRAYVASSGGNTYPIISDSVAAVAISPNSSGQSRIDSIVLYVGLAVSPNSDSSNVAQLVAVQGTPSGSPVAPNAAAIQAAIGSSNPYIVLANVTVGSGVTSIVSGNITDVRSLYVFKTVQNVLTQQSTTPANPPASTLLHWVDNNGLLKSTDPSGNTKISGETNWVTLTDGATVNIDCKLGKKFFLPLMGGNRTLAFLNEYAGKDIALMIEQDGTGSRLISQWFQYTAQITAVDTTNNILTIGINVPTGTPIYFSNSGGALPTGLSANTKYYAINNSSTAIKVASSLANAQAGTVISITGAGSGTNNCLTQIRWPGDTAPTLTTNKYKRDIFGISIVSTGVYEGVIITQDV